MSDNIDQKFQCTHYNVNKSVNLTLKKVYRKGIPVESVLLIDCDSKSLCGLTDKFIGVDTGTGNCECLQCPACKHYKRTQHTN